MQVIEVIRRWQHGDSQRAIARATGLSRNTVEKYIRAAVAAGLSQDGDPPGGGLVAQLQRLNDTTPTVSAPHAERLAHEQERIAGWLKEELQLTRIHELLVQDGVAVSYTTLRRYVRRAGLWKTTGGSTRMAEWPPGEAAEMDFSTLGMLPDPVTGKRRKVSALVVVLPCSRHTFVWPLLQETLEETVGGLEAAWRFFDGVPKRLILG